MIIDDRILLHVEKPARYTGGELHAVTKEHGKTMVSFAFCFPDIYEVGMSHLGMKILYHVINEREDALCERVFSPWVDMEEKMRQNGLPLFSLETKSPVSSFDILGFTLQYEMSYTNILNMLDLGGIPLLAEQRGEGHPLVCAGGPCAVNPEPLADFIDFFILGDGEEIIHDILDAVAEKKKKDMPRGKFLQEIAALEGIYVPSLYQPAYNGDGTLKEPIPAMVQRRIVRDLDKAPYPDRMIVPYINIVHDRVMLEIFRGCVHGCRFCQAGYIYRPVRERSVTTLMNHACSLLASTGYEEISLSSLSTSDYTHLEELTTGLLEMTQGKNIGISLPSLRADNFTFGLMEKVQSVRKSGLTFAPEAGTQRMRDVINKNVREEDILSSAETAFKGGWNNIKLYFMLGLPHETEEDVEGIADLVYKILKKGNSRSTVTVSTAFFIPKPFTPFQWEPQDTLEQMVEKQRILARRLQHRRITYNWHDFQLSRLEAAFSRGDRKLGKVLLKAWESGCRFDGWAEHFRYDRWLEAFEACSLDIGFYTDRTRAPDEVFPWDHMDTGIKKSFLWKEKLRSEQETLTVDCSQGCSDCGILQFKGGACRGCCDKG
ncbi:MAG: TIGR03960 family B12-binding radical SAM protein [Clostridia bacterium]